MSDVLENLSDKDGCRKVTEIISKWSKVYINQVFCHPKDGADKNSPSDCKQYEVEFSKPVDKKPIPHGTVKIYFTVFARPADEVKEDGDNLYYEFNFENESLIHKLDGKTMRTNMFESWIDKVLEKKLKIQEELHLGTEFE
jgi:hypothetical protein|tara:strand:- start:269 stop:691 length:423 start_codon:yes stop_codon:yes gene_type:complete